MTKHAVNEQIICSIDLGINTDAVCTIMRSDGTILGRKFIDFPVTKTGCTMFWAEFADFKENMVPGR